MIELLYLYFSVGIAAFLYYFMIKEWGNNLSPLSNLLFMLLFMIYWPVLVPLIKAQNVEL
jgi:hypothetical protein